MRNILFSGNIKVFDGILTCMLSIFMRTKSDEQITFLDDVAKSYNKVNEVIKIDVTDLYMSEFSGCPNEGAYCSPYTLLRLFADKIPQIPDKLLYLDADILFNREPEFLYDIDVTGYEYAAARDHYGKYLLNPNYINAGVLLLNMKQIKQTGLFEKARTLIKTKKLLFADQDAIYKSTTRKKMLPQRFNDQKFLHDHTIVRHFSKRLFWLPYPHTANIKQWNVSAVHRIFKYDRFDDVLFEYIYLKKKYAECGSLE